MRPAVRIEGGIVVGGNTSHSVGVSTAGTGSSIEVTEGTIQNKNGGYCFALFADNTEVVVSGGTTLVHGKNGACYLGNGVNRVFTDNRTGN